MKFCFRCIASLCVLFLLSSASCDDEVNKQEAHLPIELKTPWQSSQFGFGLTLLQQIHSGKQAENVIISPWSVHSALLMAAGGAKGATRDEIVAVLGLKGYDIDELHKTYGKTSMQLSKIREGTSLSNANAVFYDPGRIVPTQNFLDQTTAYFKANKATLNFGDPAAVEAINEWVSENTNGKIEKIIDQISADQMLFLINAVHFKADWEQAFAEELTRSAPFMQGNGKSMEAAMMHHTGAFQHTTHDGFQMVDLAFKDSIYSMTLIRPEQFDVNDDLSWIQHFTIDQFTTLRTKLSSGRIALQMPKMELTFGESMIPHMEQMGMREAFSKERANFSAMGTAQAGNIFLDEFRHDAVLLVDEKGAEGAAVTSLTFGATSMPPSYHFNVPFLAVVSHKESGALIFMAMVTTPQEAQSQNKM